MSDILDRATAHFKSQLTGQPQEIDVPEWGTKIYVRPMNGIQHDAIYKLLDKGQFFEARVEALLQRAKDADGKPVFNRVERQELLRSVDPKVIVRITDEMLQFEETDVKNS